jgi:hypothetical protein
MRDPARIPRMLKLLAEAWDLVPDWRLGQLLSNVQGLGGQDVLHTEDDVWETNLARFVARHRPTAPTPSP